MTKQQLHTRGQKKDEKEALDVLSIDWDYFMLMDDEARMHSFPRGHQHLDFQILANAWADCYNANRALRDCGIDEMAIDKVNEAIMKGTISQATVAVDHDSILQLLPRDRKLNVYNVDYHHDSWPCDRGQRTDCENWASFLHNQGRLRRYIWISTRRKQEPDPRDNPPAFVERAAIDILQHVDFDLMFICLSPLWSPPHLDREFFAAFPIPPKFRSLVGNRWRTVRERAKERQPGSPTTDKRAAPTGTRHATTGAATLPNSSTAIQDQTM